MQPLKTIYAHETEIWLKEHQNRVATYCQNTGLVGKAYLKSATAAIVANGFEKIGLFPYKLHITNEQDPGRISTQQHKLFA
jgi:hypothetical protein